MRWFIFPFCSIFMVLGVWIAWSAFKNVIKPYSVRSWPTVDADILSSSLVMNPSYNSIAQEVQCEYNHVVDGKKFVGSGVFPGYAFSVDAANLQLNNALRNSKIVRVFYNCNSPNESYLIAGPLSFHLSSVFWGILVFSVGLFMLLSIHCGILDASSYVSELRVVK